MDWSIVVWRQLFSFVQAGHFLFRGCVSRLALRSPGLCWSWSWPPCIRAVKCWVECIASGRELCVGMDTAMDTTSKLDLAVLTFEQLRAVAQGHNVRAPDGLTRAELVPQLRKAGIGVLPSLVQSGLDSVVTGKFDELVHAVGCVSAELAAMRADRRREASVVASLDSRVIHLESEVEALRLASLGSLKEDVYASESESRIHAQEPASSPPPAISRPLPVESRSRVQPPYSAVLQGTVGSCAAAAASARPDSVRTGPGAGSSTASGWRDVNRRRHRNKFDTAPTATASTTRNEALARTVTSAYQKPTPVNTSPNVLTGAARTRRKVFFIGNITPGCEATSIVNWCKERDVEVLACSVATSRYFGTSYARLTVPEETTNRVMGDSFWPETIQHAVRPWRFSDGVGVSADIAAQ